MSLTDLWRRKRQTDPEAAHALAEAKEALTKAKAQRPQVEHASQTMVQLRTDNHFAESFANLVKGG